MSHELQIISKTLLEEFLKNIQDYLSLTVDDKSFLDDD